MNRPTAGVAIPWVFNGLRPSAALQASGDRAARWRAAGGEWVRPLLTAAAWRRDWGEDGPAPHRWVVDFPPGADERDLTGAGVVGAVFRRAGGRIARRGPAAELRIALAKCDRYLATPAGAGPARWRWVPATALPGGALVAVVRDDEFLAGVLASRWFALWRGGRRLSAALVRDFPLPWPVATARGALSREQEERREAVVRAWRAAGGGVADLDSAGDAAEELAAAVAATYGWPAGIDAEDGLARLRVRAPE